MDETSFRVLLIEDAEEYALFIKKLLAKASVAQFEVDVATTLGAARQWLAAHAQPDVILCDLTLPDSDGLRTFESVYEEAPEATIIVLTGIDDGALALETVQRGAQDYIVKRDVAGSQIVRAMRHAIERKRAQRQIRTLNSELEFRVAERTRELSEANEALAKANEELVELDRMKSAFIDVTSHEMRTPVLTIRGMLHIIRSRIPKDDERLCQSVDAAMRGARRLESIVARTLEIMRAGEFVRTLNRRPVDPAELIRDVVADVRPIAELRDQELTTDLPNDLPTVNASRQLTRDVLINLLMNAVKFSRNGGAIHVSARHRDDVVEFRVSDNGVGISEADKPHVFEQFFTSLDSLHHSSGEYGFLKRGIGLGLSIVKNFVELHGGEVHVDSTLEKGSTFLFTLPISG